MPVSKHALRSSDQGQFLGDLENNPYPKHHLATDDDLLRYLGDAIAVPSPDRTGDQLGDILTYGGVGIVIVAAMRKPGRRQPDPVTDRRSRMPADDLTDVDLVPGQVADPAPRVKRTVAVRVYELAVSLPFDRRSSRGHSSRTRT